MQYNQIMHFKFFNKAASLCLYMIALNHITAAPAKAATLPQDNKKAVILTYHRIGEDSYPDSNIRIEQFNQQIEELEKGGYNIIALPQLLDAIANAKILPPKTIAITLDGAYESAWKNAIPTLLDKDIPFTLFYAANKADENAAGFMSWKQLKKLKNEKTVTLGVLPAYYNHTAHLSGSAILASLNKARSRHREYFGEEVKYIAYPHGETSNSLIKLTQSQGFTAGFTLRSGPYYPGIDLYDIPRFSITEDFADLERFQRITNTLPLPMGDITPNDYDLSGVNTFMAGFTIPDALAPQIDSLNCFISGYNEPLLNRLGTRIEIRLDGHEIGSRMRLNCTMPENAPRNENVLGSDETLQWRWSGMLFHKEQEEPSPQEDELPALQE